MPKTIEYQLHPFGWENDPEEERLRFSSLDYLAACTYNSYAIFFKLEDEEKPKVTEVLKEGLERTLAQCRQLVGTIEKNKDDDDHSFVKRKDTSVKFVVKYFEAEDNFPSISEIEKAHFASSSLGDVTRLVVEGMAYGEKPECLPSASPVISAYQANFIPGGLIFLMNFHHYANDVMGWANFVHQLAENCYSIVNKTVAPPWDPANLDASRFTAADFPSESKVNGPTPPDRHPLLLEHSSLLFHLPKSKAEELKKLATPDNGSWISTYDAFSALLWRIMTKHRAPLYKSDIEESPIFLEAVNMRRRTDPPVAKRQQRNLFWAAVSASYPDPLKVKQIVSEAPLSNMAAYIRMLTDSMNQDALDKALAMLAPVRDKTCLFTRVNSLAPLSTAMTDWRETAICETDFGFAQPVAYRHLFDAVTEGLILIYPPRKSDNPDEGCEFVLTFETDIVKPVLDDPDLMKYFDFRGYEVKPSK
ncbi:Omega-hydroxypalmitate O-feruloyl transferase [Pleurostoma richardsiae]|uniref:Omega-hydroxypalmitate O-feruloyl transferase n=1 Tax=Pleurostoma richardsiae TaxID=41990 RepID=A0AA38VMP5_9PEZI|nr:Omega-hydroxypalmitate O-feruloyl transferase [Pleurostoma richardsiae]